MENNTIDICALIDELIAYGLKEDLIDNDDRTYTINRLLELFEEGGYEESGQREVRDLHLILEDMTEYALKKGILESDTTASRDLFDTKIMGLITPPPSVVRQTFFDEYISSSKDATNWYYSFSKATNYIRTDRIKKDIKWVSSSPFGDLDITINLSKPEKDPRDIANALNAKSTGYPKCLLCRENEGYAGSISHPARQNHRVIPINLCGQPYYIQYSPYVYYNEHCIVFNESHIPMKIDEDAFAKLLDFVQAFPHYMIGSNADLPIVGGSILTHDHFQGGCYEFPMVRAGYKEEFGLEGFDEVAAGIINWPLSTIRLRSKNMAALVKACTMILSKWREYSDEESFIYAYTNEGSERVPHNTITPIARMRDKMYEMDLVLRNNITTDEHPLGVYHPHSEYHHIKKENIGLIEVMGMAILPARLRSELKSIEDIIKENIAEADKQKATEDICSLMDKDESLKPHTDWIRHLLARDFDTLKDSYKKDAGAIQAYIRQETGTVFSHVLENAGVYKQTPEGLAGFKRFIATIGYIR